MFCARGYLIRPHPGLPRRPIVAGAHRTSRSYLLASLRALHLDLRLVVSDQAAVEESGTPGDLLTASAGQGHSRPVSEVPDLGWGPVVRSVSCRSSAQAGMPERGGSRSSRAAGHALVC